jgi:hypothetical protein
MSKKGSVIKQAMTQSVSGLTNNIAAVCLKVAAKVSLEFHPFEVAQTVFDRKDLDDLIEIIGHIMLPMFPDDIDVSDEQYSQLLAYVAHEVLHLLLSHEGTWKRAQREGDKYLRILNCCDDIFIEAVCDRHQLMAGATPHLDAVMQVLIEKSEQARLEMHSRNPNDPDNDPSLSNVAHTPWLIKMYGYGTVVGYEGMQKHLPECIQAIANHPYCQGILQLMSFIKDQVESYSLEEAIVSYEKRSKDLLNKIIDIFSKPPQPKEEEPPEPDNSQPQPPEPDEPGRGDGEGGDGKGKGGDTQPGDKGEGDAPEKDKDKPEEGGNEGGNGNNGDEPDDVPTNPNPNGGGSGGDEGDGPDTGGGDNPNDGGGRNPDSQNEGKGGGGAGGGGANSKLEELPNNVNPAPETSDVVEQTTQDLRDKFSEELAKTDPYLDAGTVQAMRAPKRVIKLNL